MAISVNLEKALDKAYENKDLKDVLDAPRRLWPVSPRSTTPP